MNTHEIIKIQTKSIWHFSPPPQLSAQARPPSSLPWTTAIGSWQVTGFYSCSSVIYSLQSSLSKLYSCKSDHVTVLLKSSSAHHTAESFLLFTLLQPLWRPCFSFSHLLLPGWERLLHRSRFLTSSRTLLKYLLRAHSPPPNPTWASRHFPSLISLYFSSWHFNAPHIMLCTYLFVYLLLPSTSRL